VSTSPAPVDELTALDAAFLHIERAGLPVHIGSVATFEAAPLLHPDGSLRLGELRAQVEARLDRVPRLRRRVVRPAFGLGRPRWVDDPSFDVAEHVDAVALDGVDTDGLRAYAEDLMAEPLPPDRPLWHLRIVTGLTQGRVALVQRVHHALVDGVSSVDVALMLLDLTPEVEDLPPTRWTAQLPESDAASLASLALRQATIPLRVARSAFGVARDPRGALRAARDTVEALAAVVGDGLVAPRTSLNQPVGAQRHLAWITTDLDAVKACGRAHQATANDVILSAVAHGLRQLLLERGAIVGADDALKVLVPVSRRGDGQRGTLGNRVGARILRLPIGIADPVERLAAVARIDERLKHQHEATTAQRLLAAVDHLPEPLVGPMAHLTDTQRLVNVIVTNVPGPADALYCRGARMLEVFPFVPLGGNLCLSVAIVSYERTLTLGVTVDPVLVPDLDVFARGVEAGFRAVGAVPPTRPTTRRRTPATRSAKSRATASPTRATTPAAGHGAAARSRTAGSPRSAASRTTPPAKAGAARPTAARRAAEG